MLVKTQLESGLRKILDKDYSMFKGFPDSYELSAQNFGNVINTYASVVTPVSTTSAAALSAFVATFISSKSKGDVTIITDAIAAYAAALAVGMLPAFQGVPPIGGSALIASFKSIGEMGLNGVSAQNIAKLMATAIDTYFKTGTAINVITGITVPWT